MADKDLLALSAAGALGGTEYVYLVDASGNSKKVALSDLKTFINTDPSIVPSSEPWRGCRVSLSSNLAVATSSTTAIPYATATQSETIWSAGAPTRLVVPVGVTKVRLKAGISWASSAATVFKQSWFFKNGSEVFAGNGKSTQNNSVASTTWGTIASAVLSVTAGDYFEHVVRHNQGSNLSISADSFQWFELEIVEG